MPQPTISFEFFPPKSAAGEEALIETARTLSRLNPKLMTVTFGAGGGACEGTLRNILALKKAAPVPFACHLTFISLTKSEVSAYLQRLWDEGVHHVVALRGDMPKDLQWPLDRDQDYYQYTSDFVEAIKAHHPFTVSVGAYPEKHPDAPTLAADITALKKKCDAGADHAITQFFFNHDSYFDFLEEVTKAGIKTPIIPGLLPILNYSSMLGFADRCGTIIPSFVREKFEGRDEADHPAIAEDLLLWQIDDLRARGVSHFHFYTLNKSDLLLKTCKSAGLGV